MFCYNKKNILNISNIFFLIFIFFFSCQPDFEIKIIEPKDIETIKIGDIFQYGADVKGNSNTPIDIEWTSSDILTATVNQNGLVTAKNSGFVNITATIKGTEFKSSKELNISGLENLKIKIIPESRKVEVGESFLLNAYLENFPNHLENDFFWIIEDSNIVERVIPVENFKNSSFMAKKKGETLIRVESSISGVTSVFVNVEVVNSNLSSDIIVNGISGNSATVHFSNLSEQNTIYQVWLLESDKSDKLTTIADVKANGTKKGEVMDEKNVLVTGLTKNKVYYVALIVKKDDTEILNGTTSFVTGSLLYYDFTLESPVNVVLDNSIYGFHAQMKEGKFNYSSEGKFTFNNDGVYLQFPVITNVHTFFIVAAFSNEVGNTPILGHTNAVENDFLSSPNNFVINKINNPDNYKNTDFYTNGFLSSDNTKIQFFDSQAVYAVKGIKDFTSLKANSTRAADRKNDNWRGAFKKLIIFTNKLSNTEFKAINNWLDEIR